MIRPDQLTQDQFWNAIERDEAPKRDLRARIDGCERSIALGKRALQLQHSPGFQDFVKAIEDVRQHVLGQMVACMQSNDFLRYLQGKAQALNDVLALISKAGAQVADLEAKRKILQDELDKLNRPARAGGV